MPTLPVRILKRAIDVAAAGVGLALTLPLYPALALAIVIDSKGPVFYAQRRAGTLISGDRDGRSLRFDQFTMLKFRTMRVDAEKGTGAVLAEEDDPRVTRLGRMLRKSRLDELPQLLNVLIGQMSLVGPRPERPELIELLAEAIPFFEERMRGVKPGLTGLAQISLGYTGRPREGSPLLAFGDALVNPWHLEGAEGAVADDMRMKLLYDMAYAATLEDLGAFVRTELRIIFATPYTMLAGLGR